MRIGSLIAGFILLAIGLIILLPTLYYYNLAVSSASQVGLGGAASEALGGAYLGGVAFGFIFTIAGIVLTANGFRRSITKISVDDIQKLGLTGQQIKETAGIVAPKTSVQVQSSPSPPPTPTIGAKFCGACGAPAFSADDLWCRKCGKSLTS
jgi:hypothetical protein